MKHIWKFTLPAHLIGLASLAYVIATGQYWFLAVAVVMWALLSIGVEVGIHRLFSHRSFETPRWIEVCLMYLGTIAGQGSVPFWVAVHKGYHHPYADTEKDPHTPTKGLWHGYVGWLIDDTQNKLNYRSVVSLLRDPKQAFFHEHYYKTIILTVLILAVIHPLLAGMYFFATTIAIQQNFIVNVCCHTSSLGYRSFDTKDLSRNVKFLSIPSWGLSLHNNHHHDPGNWNLSKSPTELDISAWVIKMISTSRRAAREML